ncbi:antiviral innate immune response receptor RIG-I-like [Xenia sp. Carnegie-2017]|uniref:antiviral innate immune response receptor RIG-I-like n=1 Tax=Xenia sp. Carnegie-2017 TaxID=2897299 RepID=UPI001F03A3EB|nr:antiviral innate immune response receptor RIG-I-like [Xenia sp. Carnegie-2017]
MIKMQADWKDIRRRQRYFIREIDPLKVIEVMQDVFTQEDCENVRTACTNHGPIVAVRDHLLGRLKRRGPNSLPKFVLALRKTGQEHAAQLIDPKLKVRGALSNCGRDDRVLEPGVAAGIHSSCNVMQQVYMYIKLRMLCHIFFCYFNLDVACVLMKEYENGNLKSSIIKKLCSYNFGDICFQDLNFNLVIEPDESKKVIETLDNFGDSVNVLVVGMEKLSLKLRDYQSYLVQPALEGKNTIICAPTGSGKTFVAMEAIKQHVCSSGHRYVAFIVTNLSLVYQQECNLAQYLPESVGISSLCGSNSPTSSLPQLLEEYQVIVLTAQVLVNSLKKDKTDAPGEKELTIGQFSSCFDECHHTIKGHPYNEIIPNPCLPQIIGLSASPGIGTSSAEKHIMELCANLDVQEIQLFVGTQPASTSITTFSQEQENAFRATVDPVMCRIEVMISEKDFEKSAHPHGSQPYENWVVEMCKKGLGRDIFTCFEHLKEYNNSLMINEDVRSEDALRYLKENINYKSSTDMEERLRVLFDDAVSAIECSSPVVSQGLQVLEQRLVEKLSGDGNKSKGIIFVKTRLIALALLNWLESTTSLKVLVNNPSVVIGCSGQSNGGGDKNSPKFLVLSFIMFHSGGMSKAKQDQKIKNFRNGDSNVIIATSVLLEGIDVPDCNFVINYGMPGNEITFMQARGRVRSRETGGDGWQYEIIVPSEQAKRKKRDIEKEKIMKDALLKIENLNKNEFDEFERQLLKIQHKILEEYNKISTKNPAKNITDDVKLLCKKCGVFACKAKDIKKLMRTRKVPVGVLDLI